MRLPHFLRGPYRITTALLALFVTHAPQAAELKLISARKIWDAAPHNAFTDLTRFRDQWWCVFREGEKHVSPDGAVRVLQSTDGDSWQSAARVTSAQGDLRDPKIVVTPQHQLLLLAAVAKPTATGTTHQSVASLSADGRTWPEPTNVGDPDVWLWRVAWHGTNGLGIGYDTRAEKFIRLYRTTDGRHFETLRPTLFDQGYPNETGIAFEPDGTAVCLLRRDGTASTGQLGRAKPPYLDWTWQDLGVRVGGPQLLRLPDGRYLAGVRLYDGGARTSLAWIDVAHGKLHEALKLPSGGDTSYPGLVLHEGQVWVSYYSSHEGKTAIYLARAALN